MKNTALFLGIALLGVAPAAMAQRKMHREHHETPAVVTPPGPVDSAFQAKFSGNTATWMKTPGGNYCALLDTSTGRKEYVEFAADGQWIRTRTELSLAQLPDSAKAALQARYPEMAVTGVEKMEYLNVNPFYRVDLREGDATKSVVVNDAGYIAAD